MVWKNNLAMIYLIAFWKYLIPLFYLIQLLCLKHIPSSFFFFPSTTLHFLLTSHYSLFSIVSLMLIMNITIFYFFISLDSTCRKGKSLWILKIYAIFLLLPGKKASFPVLQKIRLPPLIDSGHFPCEKTKLR